MISMTRQANQAGQILLVTLTIGTGTEWTPRKRVLHKNLPAGLELFILLMHVVLCLVGTRKSRESRPGQGKVTLTMWRSALGDVVPNTATRWSFLGLT